MDRQTEAQVWLALQTAQRSHQPRKENSQAMADIQTFDEDLFVLCQLGHDEHIIQDNLLTFLPCYALLLREMNAITTSSKNLNPGLYPPCHALKDATSVWNELFGT